MKSATLFFALALSTTLASSLSFASPFQNLNDVRRGLGFEKLAEIAQSKNRKVKVAILDKGFTGVDAEIGKTLPSSTVYVAGPIAAPEDLKSDHGLRMAQIVTGLFSEDAAESKGLELRLYNVFGFSNFKAAIADLVKRKYDVILYSEVWEYGGNLDGRGFINTEVNRAVRAGVIWINAAGNFGGLTYNGSIKTIKDNWVQLPEQNNGIRLICKADEGKKCPAKAVLSWNDFKDDSEAGTDKDLDLALTDDLVNVLESSSLRQSDDREEARPGYSKYPREIVSIELDPGTYYLKVKNVSKNFGKSDRLRITVDGENLEMPAADPNESLLTPADNDGVITVGAFDSERSGRSVRLGKPDLLAPSSLSLDAENEFRGSSNSAAFTAAAVALLKLASPKLDREGVLARMRPYSWEEGTLSLRWMGFQSTKQNCFPEGAWPKAPAHVKEVIAAGGKLVQTTQGWRMMTPFDPLLLTTDLARRQANDMVVATADGYQVVARNSYVAEGAIEVFQRPVEAGICLHPDSPRGILLGF
jgi:hypothetical protein